MKTSRYLIRLFYFCVMKVLTTICAILALLTLQSQAQRKLTMYKTFGGVIYELNDSVQLSIKQTASILFQNQHAYQEFGKARTYATVSSILGFSGAAMVAVPVATVAFGEKSDWGLAGGGAVLLLGSILVNQAYKAKALDALDIYNETLPKKTSGIQPRFYFYGTGATLVIKF